MTRADSSADQRQLLVCDLGAGEGLMERGLRELVVAQSTEAILFDVTGREAVAHAATHAIGLQLSPRYMDRFYFCIAATDAYVARAVVTALFEAIAGSYEHGIDVGRNRENARNLLLLVLERDANPGRVLDFGLRFGLGEARGRRSWVRSYWLRTQFAAASGSDGQWPHGNGKRRLGHDSAKLLASCDCLVRTPLSWSAGRRGDCLAHSLASVRYTDCELS